MTDERSVLEVRCEWCGEPFAVDRSSGGPIPRYCKRSHRQRAYEARRATSNPTTTSQPSFQVDVEKISDLIESAVLAPEDLRRPTAARARLESLLGGLAEALEELGIADLDDHATVARLAATPRFVNVAEQARQTLAEAPRKTMALQSAGDSVESALRALCEPESLQKSMSLGPVPILVPPWTTEGPLVHGPVDEQFLPTYLVQAAPAGRHDTQIRFDHPSIRSAVLSDVLPGWADNYPLNRADTQRSLNAWIRLGQALIVVATGYHHPDAGDPPPSLTSNQYIGKRLRQQLYGSDYWTIPLSAVRDMLIGAAHIRPRHDLHTTASTQQP